MPTRSLGLFSLIAACLIATSSIVSADTITYASPGVTLQNTELTNVAMTFPDWDPLAHPGDTLTGVSFTLNGSASGSITLTNGDAVNSHSATGTTNVTMILTDPNGGTNTQVIPSFTTGTVNLNPSQSITVSPLSGSASSSGAGAGPLSAYEGVGSFTADINTSTGFSLSGGGGQVGSSQSTQASATGSVTYTFTGPDSATVPEPSTLVALGGLGAMGLLFAARRRRRAA